MGGQIHGGLVGAHGVTKSGRDRRNGQDNETWNLGYCKNSGQMKWAGCFELHVKRLMFHTKRVLAFVLSHHFTFVIWSGVETRLND